MDNRAYSILSIKSVKEDERIITGIASTPSTDRMGDIVESEGAKFKLPMPLLWQHNSREPVGWVTAAKPNKDGIPITAKFAKVDEPGDLKNITDKAWQATKLGLTSGLSIGFTVNSYEIMKEGGLRIKDWDWLELSVVTIPANQDATISMVRSLDEELRAGKQRDVGAAGIPPKPPLKIKERTMPRTNQEKLREAEARRSSLTAQMTALMDAADEKGEALDTEQDTKWTEFKAEVDQLDKHIGRLQDMERISVTRAAPVRGADPAEAAASRGGGTTAIHVRQREIEPWRPFVRFVLAQARAQGNLMMAAEIAKSNEQWMAESPEVAEMCKAAVAVGTTTDATWAGPLVQYQNLTSAFAEYLRPLTILGRIPGLRHVPFKIRVPRMTGGATVNWVGEGAPKPLSALAFDSITLDFTKIAGIIPLTEELVRFSSPSAEAIVRDELAAAIIQFMDAQFVDPSKAATGISPASITNGITPITPSGTNAAALRADVARLMQAFLNANMSLASAVWLMTQGTAMRIGLMNNTLGQPEFAGINVNGGTFAGIPVVSSENIPSTTGSPSEGFPIILAKASEILLADDGQVTIDASREASLQMESTPDSPATASTVLTSLWQNNMIAIKAERFINWRLRRANAVQYISAANYS